MKKHAKENRTRNDNVLAHVLDLMRTTRSRRFYVLPGGVKTRHPAYEHQVVGIAVMSKNREWALLDDTGMGKTYQAVYAAASLIARKQLDAVLVACPSDCARNWEDEVRSLLPGVRVQRISAKQPFAQRTLDPRAKFYIVNHELLSVCYARRRANFLPLQRDAKRIEALMRRRKFGVVVDEGHVLRTPTTNIHKVLVALGSIAYWRVLMTATPIAEHAENAWGLFRFLDGGSLLGNDYKEFCTRYCVVKKRWRGRGYYIVGYKNLDELSARIASKSLRRLKSECLDLPPKTTVPRYFTASGAHASLMEELRDGIIEELDNLREEGRGNHVGNALGRSTGKLSRYMNAMWRASACPWVVDASVSASPKLDYLLREVLTVNRNALAWVYHKDVARACVDYLRAHGVSSEYVASGVDVDARDDILQRFAGGALRVVVATSALKQGRTITCTQHAEYLQLPNRLLDWKQSQDRVYRIGTRGTVVIGVPLLEQSLDALLWGRIRYKGTTAKIIEDNEEDGDAVFTASNLREALEWNAT